MCGGGNLFQHGTMPRLGYVGDPTIHYLLGQVLISHSRGRDSARTSLAMESVPQCVPIILQVIL